MASCALSPIAPNQATDDIWSVNFFDLCVQFKLRNPESLRNASGRGYRSVVPLAEWRWHSDALRRHADVFRARRRVATTSVHVEQWQPLRRAK